jgi:hypothetical protein
MSIRLTWKGRMKRSPIHQIALAVRILDSRHFDDVYDRARDELGDRADVLGPLDLTRNPLRAYVDRVNRIHQAPPPLVDNLSKELAEALGDRSASTTVQRYAAAGGRPMPTSQVRASVEALVYRLGATYAGVLIGYSERSGQAYLQVITPDDLTVEYASHDPTEPTVITHCRQVMHGGEWSDVDEVYDLTDMAAPSYRVMRGDKDITAEVHGRAFEGEGYPWRYADGTPYHRIVIVGDPRRPYATNALIEATLGVSVLYSHWRAGIRDAGHPQRNVRGLQLAGLGSDADSGQAGVSTGPETVLQWVDIDPDRPGAHWQDGPGFDPEVVGRAIRTYELAAMAALGLPLNYEQTGGEPTEQERKALEQLRAMLYAEARRMDSEVLRRVAALLNRTPDAPSGLDESPYGVLYAGEVEAALEAATMTTPEEDPDDRRAEPGQPGGQDPEQTTEQPPDNVE